MWVEKTKGYYADNQPMDDGDTFAPISQRRKQQWVNQAVRALKRGKPEYFIQSGNSIVMGWNYDGGAEVLVCKIEASSLIDLPESDKGPMGLLKKKLA